MFRLLLLVLVVACSSKSDKKPGATTAKTAGIARAPAVTVAAVIVADPPKPPPIVLVLDDKGALFANKVATWDELSAKDPLVGAYPTDRYKAQRRLAEGRGLGQPTDRIFEMFEVRPGDVDLEALDEDLASLEDPRTRDMLAQDDPPPPEEEDLPDDGEEESGGTGTAMALDEGKMGKADSDRAEGQYKMQKNQEDPQLVAAMKAEQAKRLARRPLHDVAGMRAPTLGARGDKATPLNVAVGEVIKDGKLDERPYAVLLAAPKAKAVDFIETIAVTHAWIGVAHAGPRVTEPSRPDSGLVGKVRPLRIETIPERDYVAEPRRWIELRVGTTDLAFEAVPDVPVPLTGALDQAAFTAALDKARKSRALDPLVRVDVLVEPTVDVQRVVDVLVALDQAGVVMIGLGPVPDANSEEAKFRGTRVTEFYMGQFNALGDLDKALIRRYVKRDKDKILACHTKANAKTPGLSGTVSVQFFIKPDGKVATSTASGVDPSVAKCIADVIKGIEFPKPKGDGGVQVNYPFTFEP